MLSLSGQEKVISKNSEVDQCTPVEAAINSEQLSEPAEMPTKDQKEFECREMGGRSSTSREK